MVMQKNMWNDFQRNDKRFVIFHEASKNKQKKNV